MDGNASVTGRVPLVADEFDLDLRLGELGGPHRLGRQPGSPVAAQDTVVACDTVDTCDGPTCFDTCPDTCFVTCADTCATCDTCQTCVNATIIEVVPGGTETITYTEAFGTNNVTIVAVDRAGNAAAPSNVMPVSVNWGGGCLL